MKDSTRRAFRTAYQTVLALALAIPTIALVLPSDSGFAEQAAIVVVWAGFVTKALNALEEHGIIPAWLKGDQEADGADRA